MPERPLPARKFSDVYAVTAPDGRVWKCPDCDYWAKLGTNAVEHAQETGHDIPNLEPQPVLTVAESTLTFDGATYRVRIERSPLGITNIRFTTTRPPLGLDAVLYEFTGRLIDPPKNDQPQG